LRGLYGTKRAKPRYLCRAHALLLRENQRVSVHTVNISETGVYLASDDELPSGNGYRIRIELDNVNTFEATGKIVRRRQSGEEKPDGYGFQFSETSPEHRRRLRSFLRSPFVSTLPPTLQ